SISATFPYTTLFRSISLAQTAEGAMVEIGNNLQRVRELAVQSANATNSQSDRDALQAEVTQLVSEIDRVSRQTNFNGTSLLDGTFSGALFQIGADAGQTIGINSIVNASVNALGKAQFSADATIAAFAADDAAADTTVKGLGVSAYDADGNSTNISLGDIKIAKGESQSAAIAAAINEKMDATGVYAKVNADKTITLSSVKADQTFSFGATDGTDPEFDQALVAGTHGVAMAAGAETALAAAGSNVGSVD